jgi:hypothetical protein
MASEERGGNYMPFSETCRDWVGNRRATAKRCSDGPGNPEFASLRCLFVTAVLCIFKRRKLSVPSADRQPILANCRR